MLDQMRLFDEVYVAEGPKSVIIRKIKLITLVKLICIFALIMYAVLLTKKRVRCLESAREAQRLQSIYYKLYLSETEAVSRLAYVFDEEIQRVKETTRDHHKDDTTSEGYEGQLKRMLSYTIESQREEMDDRQSHAMGWFTKSQLAGELAEKFSEVARFPWLAYPDSARFEIEHAKF